MHRIRRLRADANGKYRYHALTAAESADKRTPFDFADPGTRELTAHDYVYAIRRLATTRIKSASFSLMAEHIVGLKEYGERIAAVDKELRKVWIRTESRSAVPRPPSA